MSVPDRWQGRPPGRPFKSHRFGYRCLYCRKGVPTKDKLTRHEFACAARDSMQRVWSREIERGIRKLGA